MTTTNQSTSQKPPCEEHLQKALEREDYHTCIYEAFLIYLQSDEFHQQEEELRRRTLRHIYTCYFHL